MPMKRTQFRISRMWSRVCSAKGFAPALVVRERRVIVGLDLHHAPAVVDLEMAFVPAVQTVEAAGPAAP